MSKMVIASMGDGFVSKTATTRVSGSYLFVIRNPLYGITTVSSSVVYLRNSTATPIPVGRVWSTLSGSYSANINLLSKRNITENPATGMVTCAIVDMAGNPVTEIPAGTVNAPGMVKIMVPHGPGGTSGEGGLVIRWECDYAGARMERSVTLSKGHLQIQSSHAAVLTEPSSTETTDWATGAAAGTLVSEVHFICAEDVCNVAVVGDSHVACYIAGDECNSWTHAANDRFRAAGKRINLVNYGRSGSTSPDWTARIQDRIDRLGFEYTALLTKTWTVNEAGTEYTLAERDTDIAEIAQLISYCQSKGVAPLFTDVVLPTASSYNTAQEVQYIRDTHAACGSRIYLDAYRSLLVDPDAAIPTTIPGFLRPDNLHLSCPVSSFGVLDARPDPQVYGVDRYAVTMFNTFPTFLDAQGVPRP